MLIVSVILRTSLFVAAFFPTAVFQALLDFPPLLVLKIVRLRNSVPLNTELYVCTYLHC